MATAKTTAPTDEEIAAATALLQRAQTARLEAEQAKMAPVLAVVHSDEFSKAYDALLTLDDFMANPELGPHIMAARTGMNGLLQRFPLPPPAEA